MWSISFQVCRLPFGYKRRNWVTTTDPRLQNLECSYSPLGTTADCIHKCVLFQKCRNGLMPCLHFSFEGETRTIQCNCPVDSCLPPARRRQHLSLSSLPTRTICSSLGEIRKSKCNCPVGSCRSPAGWRPHLNLSSLPTRTKTASFQSENWRL